MSHPDLSSILRFFEEISQIPRASGNEAGMIDYLTKFAQERGFFCSVDNAGNVLIRKPANGSDSAPVVIQNHMDMVAEKVATSSHDFDCDPIELIYDGDILRANGTTLGADNGIGMAMALAVLDSDKQVHPALECVFTVSEEIGLIGAGQFDFAALEGRRYLNLDCEGEGIATVACAGGVRCDTVFPVPTDAAQIAGADLKITLDGLAGGHSGADINKRRTNALVMLAELISKGLAAVKDAGSSLSVVSINGGSKDNAIPRNAVAVVRTDDAETFLGALNEAADERIPYLCDSDMLCRMSVAAVPAEGRCIGTEILDIMLSMPNGILKMEEGMEDCVRTSANLAVVNASDSGIEVTLSCRSSDEAELDGAIAMVEKVATKFGGTISTRGRYPGWAMKKESDIRPLYAEAVKKVLGIDAQFVSIHAGLECGMVAEDVPDMDMISFGPVILDMHSPEETVSLSSIERFAKIVCYMLENM